MFNEVMNSLPKDEEPQPNDTVGIVIGLATIFGAGALAYLGGRLLGASVMRKLVKDQSDNWPPIPKS